MNNIEMGKLVFNNLITIYLRTATQLFNSLKIKAVDILNNKYLLSEILGTTDQFNQLNMIISFYNHIINQDNYTFASLSYYIIVSLQYQAIQILYKSISNLNSMQAIQQFVAVVPYGEAALHKAQNLYSFSKGKTMGVYNKTKDTVIQTRKGYLQFRKNLEQTLNNIVQETVNQVLTRFQNVIGVDKDSTKTEDLQHARQRIQFMLQTIFREYILKNRMVNSKRVQNILKMSKKYSVQYMVPMYINLRATLIVTKQMLIQFLQSRINEMKLTYESGKDNVVMYVSGNFNEQNIKKKVFGGIDTFKRFTVQVANRGLQIKVDRKSLVQNYDKFAVNFLQVVKEMRQKSQVNIEQAKKKSKSLYKQVISRIRAKQLQIKCQLKEQMPRLLDSAQ